MASWLKNGRVALAVFVAGIAVMLLRAWVPLGEFRLEKGTRLPYVAYLDDQFYRAMANGRFCDAPSPFTKRMLYPWLAHVISRAAETPVPIVCVVMNSAAWAVLAWCLTALLGEMTAKPWLAAVCLLTPIPLESLLFGYMPDLFHAALVSLFFLLLLRGRQRWALAALLTAFLARESTLLLCLCAAWVGWRRRQQALFWGSLAVLGAGVVAGAWFTHLGQPNKHHLPDSLYTLLKVPYNFLRNFFGIEFWADTDTTRSVPWVMWNVPPRIHLGHITKVGFSIDRNLPCYLMGWFLTTFAYAPWLVCRWRKSIGGFDEWPLGVELAFIYGLTCFVLGPCLGATVGRLLNYGWPLIWIVLPYVIKKGGIVMAADEAACLIALYLFIAWLPSLTGWGFRSSYNWLLLVPVLYALAWRCVVRIEAGNPQLANSIRAVPLRI
jgi:hypothetical protein